MFVLGTAGHIDHGKSLLVQALTGIDPDRLREEKARGMTIELGFAWLKLPSGREVGIVDVTVDCGCHGAQLCVSLTEILLNTPNKVIGQGLHRLVPALAVVVYLGLFFCCHAFQDAEGLTLGLGVVEQADRLAGTVVVRTPLASLEGVSSGRFGATRWDLLNRREL